MARKVFYAKRRSYGERSLTGSASRSAGMRCPVELYRDSNRPIAVAILVGVLGHGVNLRFKTFLLIECGMAVLSPLLNAVISDGNHTHHHG
jgi:hypothetical protein